MKKLLKQLLAVTTAIMMAITLLPAMANAETTPSHIFDKDSATLKIKKTDSLGTDLPGATFEIYKVATVNQNITTQLSYIVTDTFKKAENNPNDKGITDADVQKLGTLSGSALEAKANDLANKVKNSEGEYIKGDYSYTSGQKDLITEKDKLIEISKENFGLYLVVETSAPDGYNLGAPFFVDVPRTTEDGSAWDYAVVATPKNGSNSLDKKVAVVKEGVTVAYKTAASVNTGDTLQYTVTGTLPYLTEKELDADDVKITISDTLTGGLAFDSSFSLVAFNINGDDVKDRYLPTVNEPNNNQFTITIEAKKGTENYETNLAYIKSINGKSITLTYQAKVTNAVTYATAATNKATIKVGDEEKSKSNEPKVYTYAIQLTKKLGNDIAGKDIVEFGLYKNYNEETGKCTNLVASAKTDKHGIIKFDGLVAEGEGTTYYLKEEKTAQGYTLLSKPIAVTLIPEIVSGQPTGRMKYTIDNTTTDFNESRLAETTITNNKGFNLPSTGGMGTYIFTIGGLVVMAGAVLLIISSKKKRA